MQDGNGINYAVNVHWFPVRPFLCDPLLLRVLFLLAFIFTPIFGPGARNVVRVRRESVILTVTSSICVGKGKSYQLRRPFYM